MGALSWLLNLDFAGGGGTPVVPPRGPASQPIDVYGTLLSSINQMDAYLIRAKVADRPFSKIRTGASTIPILRRAKAVRESLPDITFAKSRVTVYETFPRPEIEQEEEETIFDSSSPIRKEKRLSRRRGRRAVKRTRRRKDFIKELVSFESNLNRKLRKRALRVEQWLA